MRVSVGKRGRDARTNLLGLGVSDDAVLELEEPLRPLALLHFELHEPAARMTRLRTELMGASGNEVSSALQRKSSEESLTWLESRGQSVVRLRIRMLELSSHDLTTSATSSYSRIGRSVSGSAKSAVALCRRREERDEKKGKGYSPTPKVLQISHNVHPPSASLPSFSAPLLLAYATTSPAVVAPLTPYTILFV